jgi:hypothetical protein
MYVDFGEFTLKDSARARFKLRFRFSDFLPLDFNLEIEGESETEQYNIAEKVCSFFHFRDNS